MCFVLADCATRNVLRLKSDFKCCFAEVLISYSFLFLTNQLNGMRKGVAATLNIDTSGQTTLTWCMI